MQMMTHLDLPTLVNLSETSKYFYNLCSYDFVWQKLIYNLFGLDLIHGDHRIQYYYV
jgi:hypothetical protein